MTTHQPPPRRRRSLPEQPCEVRFDVEKFYVEVDRRRRQQNLRWNQVGVILDVHPMTPHSWGRGIVPQPAHLYRALAWLGADLSDFIITGPPEPARPPRARDDDGAVRGKGALARSRMISTAGPLASSLPSGGNEA